MTAHVHFRVHPWISSVKAVWQPSCQVPSYDFFVIMRGYGSPPPSLNTESVILRNAPHSQCLKTMGRVAFWWFWWNWRKKFAKTYEFKNEREKHSSATTYHRLKRWFISTSEDTNTNTPHSCYFGYGACFFGFVKKFLEKSWYFFLICHRFVIPFIVL